ncbi:MAG TPA: PilZ domain-containing protein [Nitrospirota bacterium]|nr:PilZ domain-containing protein [Nitrospirota bacterium]
MEDKRQHKRLRLELLDINGKMSLAEKVELIDISLGGVSLKADRRLNFGKEILLKLGDNTKNIDMKSIVVRSELSGIEERKSGVKAMVYKVGMMFKDGQADTIAGFLNSLEQNKEEHAPVAVDRRLNVRFCITTPEEKILCFPAQFKVKVIGMGGMLIESDQSLKTGSTIPMVLSLNAERFLSFNGRVASCQMTSDRREVTYEIGVEFKDLMARDRSFIKTFVDYVAELNGNS